MRVLTSSGANLANPIRAFKAPLFFWYLFNDACGVAGDYDAAWHIFGHDSASADDAAFTDTHARAHRRAHAHPHASADIYGLAVGDAALVRLQVVVDGDEIDARTDEALIADIYPAAIHKSAVLVDKHALAKPNIAPKIRVKRRQNPAALIDARAKKLAQNLARGFWAVVAGV